MVVRGDDPQDRRKVVVNLTAAGRKLVARARAARAERMQRALDRLTASDRHAFVRLLTTYLDALEKEAE